MQEREFGGRRTRWHHERAQRLFRKIRLQVVKRHCALNAEVADPYATQLSQVCADGQTFAEIFGERSHISPRRTDHVRTKVEGAVQIIFEQLTVRFDSSELVNANTDRFTVHHLTSARQLIQLLAAAFFRGIHWWYLVYPTTETTKCGFDLLCAQIFQVRCVWTINSCTSAIAGVGRVTEPDDRVVLLVLATKKLRESRRFAEQQDQQSRRERIERACVTNASFVKNMTHPRNYVVRCQLTWFVDYD